MKFLTDGYSYCINLNHVRHIEFTKTRAWVTYGSDQERECFAKGTSAYKKLCQFAERLDDSEHRIVPAAPGFELLTFTPDDDADPVAFDIEANLDRSPVIAWHIDGDPVGYQRAIAIDGDLTFHQDDPFGSSAVLSPDGTVFAAGGYRVASLDAWVRVLREDWKQSRTRQLRVVKT